MTTQEKIKTIVTKIIVDIMNLSKKEREMYWLGLSDMERDMVAVYFTGNNK